MGLFSRKNNKEEEKQSVKSTADNDVVKVKKSNNKIKSGHAYRVLVKPLITEKAAQMGTLNKYAFEVSLRANKIEVSKAIDEVYGVKPVSVNIIKMYGKKTRYGRTIGRRKDWKKAIITLPAGTNINVYEGV